MERNRERRGRRRGMSSSGIISVRNRWEENRKRSLSGWAKPYPSAVRYTAQTRGSIRWTAFISGHWIAILEQFANRNMANCAAGLANKPNGRRSFPLTAERTSAGPSDIFMIAVYRPTRTSSDSRRSFSARKFLSSVTKWIVLSRYIYLLRHFGYSKWTLVGTCSYRWISDRFDGRVESNYISRISGAAKLWFFLNNCLSERWTFVRCASSTVSDDVGTEVGV